jgi:hypothetical protein
MVLGRVILSYFVGSHSYIFGEFIYLYLYSSGVWLITVMTSSTVNFHPTAISTFFYPSSSMSQQTCMDKSVNHTIAKECA